MSRNGFLLWLGAALAIALGANCSVVKAGEKSKDIIPTTYYDGSTDPDASFSNTAQEKQPPSELGISAGPDACPCGNGCGDNGCAGSCCCCCGPRPMWVGGIDALFLGAHVTKGSTQTTIDGTSVNGNGVATFSYAPRLWAGYQGPCWGIYGRLFYLNAAENKYDPLLAQGDTIGFTLADTLKIYTADLEAVRRLGPDCWSIYGSFGVRTAGFRANSAVSQSGIFVNTPPQDTTVAMATAANHRVFNGAGLTSGWWGEIPVKPCSCLSYVWGWRTSLLWGNTAAGGMTGASVGNSASSAGSVDSAFASTQKNLFIGELNFGLQWNHQLECVPAVAYFRVLAEYQAWYANNAFAGANSGATTAGIEASGRAEAGDLSLQLYGLSVGTGFMW